MRSHEEANLDSDELRAKRSSEREANKRDQELDDVRLILGTYQGRRFFWRYIEMCGVYQSSFTGNNTTFFKEGERSIGLRLIADLHLASPEAFPLMQKEAAERMKKEKQQFEKELEDVNAAE